MLFLALASLQLPGARVSVAQPLPPDPRFGIVDAYVNSAAASEAGAGYTRITLRWDVIQPGGVGDWKPANVPDPFIDAELAAGREVVTVLMGTPAWASADGSGSPKAVPDMSYWEFFVRRMAQQYRGRIRHWIIWNQPDVTDPNHPGNTWMGNEEDYFRLLKTAYLALKDEDATLQVHMAGLTYFWDQERGQRQYLERLLDIILADPEAAAHGYYFDAVAYHLYLNPRQSLDVIGQVQSILGARGVMAKEIWINQTNAPPSEDPGAPPGGTPAFRVSLEEQSAFVIQEYALAFGGGANRVAFYKLRDDDGQPGLEPYGLLRADNSRRPAFDAYKVVTTYLRGFRAVGWQHLGDIYAVTFDRGQTTTTVLWTMSRTPTRFTVNAIAPQATLVDERGNTQTLNATGGTYTIELPGAICTQGDNCFIGGAPRLLVEAGSPADRPGLVPLATPTATPEGTPEQATPAATHTSPAPTATVTASPTFSLPTPLPTASLVPPTSTSIAMMSDLTPSPTPQPPPTPLPPITPLSILTPSRCLILIIVGLVVFTLTYGMQMALWWRRQR
ncbi:MAG: hypothetical protein Kow0063_33640 [Anaerolineae bacterium]